MIGVDIEAENKFSYFGYICLIQISTEQNETFLIDTLAIEKEEVK
jgi:ribonuclease D